LSGDKIHALVDDPQEGERAIREILKAEGMEILSLIEVRPSLEDVFVSIIQEKKE
jgi:ABC-2 type transport system ATP-binding protein